MAEVLLITALVLALFFIFFVRPARAAEGRRRRDLNALRIGDEVLTSGGIIATVVAVETPPRGPMVLHLEIDEDVVVRAHTAAIEERLRTAEEVEASDLEMAGLEASRDESDGSAALHEDDDANPDRAGDDNDADSSNHNDSNAPALTGSTGRDQGPRRSARG